ncbi:MAG: hypothetical protein EBU18_12240 [Rhodobacteraceae bacterium]|nr:hypothetical protein [Paracoccaceae bacterium]
MSLFQAISKAAVTAPENTMNNPTRANAKKKNFLTLEDLPESELCTQNIDIFDGARNVKITMKGLKKSGNSYQCDGTYKRIAGFSESELKDGVNFPFTMTYSKQGDKFRAERFDVQSIRGRAAFVRR